MIYLCILGTLAIILGIMLWIMDKNKYSVTIWLALGALVFWGDISLVSGSWWGLIPFTLGALLFVMGLKGPESTEESPTKKLWLLTFLGRQVPVKVNRLTLILNWPVDIVGFIEINMEKVSENFTVEKPILCQDSAYVYGTISTMMVADDTDAESLMDFVNMGQMKGVKTFLEGGLTSGLQELATVNDSDVMETKSTKVSNALLNKIRTGKFTSPDSNNDIDDVAGMGFKFEKFVVNLKAEDKVIDARNKILIEIAQKKSQLQDTVTMNERIKSRMELYRTGDTADRRVTAKAVREEVFEEVALSEGKYTRVDNQRGVNLANVTPGAGGNP